MDARSPEYSQALLHSPENRRAAAASPAYFTISGQSLKYMTAGPQNPEFVDLVEPQSPEELRLKVNAIDMDYDQSPEYSRVSSGRFDQSPEFSRVSGERFDQSSEFSRVSGERQLLYSPVTIQQAVPVVQVRLTTGIQQAVPVVQVRLFKIKTQTHLLIATRSSPCLFLMIFSFYPSDSEP